MRFGCKPPRATRSSSARELCDWFRNLDLLGVKTAPAHFLGDFPAVKWKRFAHLLPQDMDGKSVLDIGCNAGSHYEDSGAPLAVYPAR